MPASPARPGDILEEGRDHLEQHQRDADGHDDLDRSKRRCPGRVILLPVGQGVFRAGDAADEQHHEEENEEPGSQGVGQGLASGRPPAVEEVHSDVGIQLHGVAAAEQVITRHHELGHFHGPDLRSAEECSRVDDNSSMPIMTKMKYIMIRPMRRLNASTYRT
jgi:hypothetical protein